MIYQDYSIRPLVIAVILQAARDASQDPDARAWLESDALVWLDAIGFDLQPDQVRRWIATGCKIRTRGALHLGTTKPRTAYTARARTRQRDRMPA